MSSAPGTLASGRARYAAVLGVPALRRLLAAALLARMPVGVHGLAIVLFLRAETGSYAVAGGVAAAFALGSGIGGPVQARAIDRLGQRRIVLPLTALNIVAMLTLLACGRAGAPAGLLVVIGAVAGAALPPLSSMLRTLMPLVLPSGELLATAFAIDAVAVELAFVVGPLLTGVMTAVASAAVAILVALVVGTAGIVWFVGQPVARTWDPPPPDEPHGMLGALRERSMVTLVLVIAPFGACLGAVEVLLPAFAEEHGSRATAGVLLAVWSLASAAGGIAFGAWRPGSARPLGDVVLAFAVVVPLAYLPLVAAGSAPVMALLLLPAGLCIAPLLSASNLLVADVAPAGMVTEAYAWAITSLVVGIAAGNAAAGALAQAVDWRAAVLWAVGAAAAGTVVAIARRASLAPQAAG